MKRPLLALLLGLFLVAFVTGPSNPAAATAKRSTSAAFVYETPLRGRA